MYRALDPSRKDKRPRLPDRRKGERKKREKKPEGKEEERKKKRVQEKIEETKERKKRKRKKRKIEEKTIVRFSLVHLFNGISTLHGSSNAPKFDALVIFSIVITISSVFY